MSVRQADGRDHRPLRTLDESTYCRRFGALLKSARENAHLTQDKLALAMGISRASIANMERGDQAPSLYRVAMLADYLQLPVTELTPSLDGSLSSYVADLGAGARSAVERVRRQSARVRLAASDEPRR